jgi:hypothetical protein
MGEALSIRASLGSRATSGKVREENVVYFEIMTTFFGKTLGCFVEMVCV